MSGSSKLLWGLTVSSMIVAGIGLAVSARAVYTVGTFEERCATLLEENGTLRARLVEQAPLPRQELVISVSGGEFGPKTIAQANRNLANVKSLANGERWEGQIGTDKHGHAIFKHSAYSIRACALVLKSYERRHGIKTVKALVERFAEGNREPYIKHLCKVLGVGPEQKISLTAHLPELLKGIVRFETGLSIGEEHLSLVAALR